MDFEIVSETPGRTLFRSTLTITPSGTSADVAPACPLGAGSRWNYTATPTTFAFAPEHTISRVTYTLKP